MRSSKRAIIDSTTLDFASIPAQSTAELTMTVNGVLDGGLVVVSAPALETGLAVSGYVSDVNEITVRVSNVTAGPIDSVDQTFSVAIIQ